MFAVYRPAGEVIVFGLRFAYRFLKRTHGFKIRFPAAVPGPLFRDDADQNPGSPRL